MRNPNVYRHDVECGCRSVRVCACKTENSGGHRTLDHSARWIHDAGQLCGRTPLSSWRGDAASGGPLDTAVSQRANAARCSHGSSVHAALELPGRHTLGREHMYFAAPTSKAVAVDAREQALREHLEQVVSLQIGLVQGLAQTVHSLRAITSQDEVVRVHLSAEQVHAAEVRLVFGSLQAANHRLAKVRPEALLIEQVGHHVREDSRTHVTLFAQPVHVAAEDKLLLQSLHVGGEPCHATHGFVVHLKSLSHLTRDGLVPQPVAPVARNGNAVFASHADDSGTVVRHDRHG
mmetsp:Transcript_33193/g.87234  ORF Transcript_33193/g.87234 Transcript_33193/m.87234 type:complete len:291 (-) Transcript_33193:112-984(-)